jgi:hypothetical protein
LREYSIKTAQEKPYLWLKKVWADDDIIELVILANDGGNTFSINVYAGHAEVKELYGKLNTFRTQIHGGIIDVTLGSFGPEYAYGAFQGRFHFARNQRGRVLVSLQMQSTFFDFGQKNVASECKMYLVTEPGLLDDFIRSFSHLDENVGTECRLECVDRE